MQGDLQSWLLDPSANDQFAVIFGGGTKQAIAYNSTKGPKLVVEREVRVCVAVVMLSISCSTVDCNCSVCVCACVCLVFPCGRERGRESLRYVVVPHLCVYVFSSRGGQTCICDGRQGAVT